MNSKDALTIAFRVDVSTSIGTGHLMEVLSLIEGLKEKVDFDPLIISGRERFVEEACLRSGIGIDNIEHMASGIGEADEAAAILRILRGRGCPHLVTDLLDRSNEFYNRLGRSLKSTCVILDDGVYREISATVVVNFSILQDERSYDSLARRPTRYFIGPRYFPANVGIRRIEPVRIERSVKRIVVNEGGSDPYGLTVRIIRAMERLRLRQRIDVVMGGAVKEGDRNEIARMKKQTAGNYFFHESLTQKAFYELLSKADMAVSAAGNTLYELCHIGVPTLIIGHHDRHDITAKAFERRGAAVNAGIGGRLSEEDISRAIRGLIDDYPLRARISGNERKIVAHGGCADALADELVKVYRKDPAYEH